MVWLSFMLSACSCGGQEDMSVTKRFLYLGHAYDHHGEGRRVDPRLENLDYSAFDRILLGGDLCSEAMQQRSTLAYLDSLFDLASPDTYYILGNHDARNGNHLWFHQFTQRPSFYTTSESGLVTLVLNTTLNPADCEQLDAQYELLKSVCDTIAEASHLLVLHHHAISLDVPGIPHPWKMANWPYLHWDANCDDQDPSYLVAIYPFLKQVHARGIEVINVMGDTGFRVKKVEAVSEDGIHYLASGIDNSRYAHNPSQLDTARRDLVLVFEHDSKARSLLWEFHDLDSLADAHPRL